MREGVHFVVMVIYIWFSYESVDAGIEMHARARCINTYFEGICKGACGIDQGDKKGLPVIVIHQEKEGSVILLLK